MTPALALLLALSWVQVRSDTFIVKSPVGVERAKEVLRDLEDFHQLMGSSFGFLNVRLPQLPIEVLLINDEAQMVELSPDFNGRPIKVAGFYQHGEDRDFIVLSASERTAPARVVYHELTHYFLGRAIGRTPAWLSEGMAEYFSFAEISNNSVELGGTDPERLRLLKDVPLLPLKALFAVDDSSPYYNEADKANIFYAESWAFVHFLYNSHQEEFKRFLAACAKGPAKVTDFTNSNLSQLEAEFHAYLEVFIRNAPRQHLKPAVVKWTMTVKPIEEADAQMSIAEIFLANGRLNLARKHLEKLDGLDDQFPRAAYYRGILARIVNDDDNAREDFVTALTDPDLAPRAAVQLVKMREYHIPAVKAELEKAVADGKAFPDVYWALSEIYWDKTRQIEEAMRLAQEAQLAAAGPRLPPPAAPDKAADSPAFQVYSKGSCSNLNYEVLSQSGAGPVVVSTSDPYFPDELLQQKVSGQVVLDVQVTDRGDVGGLWLISSSPDVFADLATTSVRQWKFAAGPSKIRLILEFHP